MRFAVTDVVDATFAEMPVEAPRYNIAPTQNVAVVTENSPRALEMMRWGLVPSWAKDVSIGSKMLNARAETLAEKPSFRSALMRKRCIIPADGFYEWKKQGKKKQPMCIHRKDDELFGFAGLWSEWTSPDGSPLRTCTIITCAANSVMEPLHDRMPAILRPEDEAAWLNASETSAGALLALLSPYPEYEIEAFPVSPVVKSAAYGGSDCIERVEEEADLILQL
jgi:putative SOS response-associated peptidase YedK